MAFAIRAAMSAGDSVGMVAAATVGGAIIGGVIVGGTIVAGVTVGGGITSGTIGVGTIGVSTDGIGMIGVCAVGAVMVVGVSPNDVGYVIRAVPPNLSASAAMASTGKAVGLLTTKA